MPLLFQACRKYLSAKYEKVVVNESKGSAVGDTERSMDAAQSAAGGGSDLYIDNPEQEEKQRKRDTTLAKVRC